LNKLAQRYKIWDTHPLCLLPSVPTSIIFCVCRSRKKQPSQVSTRWENYNTGKLCRIPHFVLNITALKTPLTVIYNRIRLHTFRYYKFLFLLLLKRRKWNIIKYETTCSLFRVLSSAVSNYLVRMHKLVY
jgi:hypothetical protein